MSSSFLFIKVDQGFPEHPQTVGLSDRAFRAVVELWCYCHRANTDGKVPNAIFNRYGSRCKTELLAHYVEDRGDHYFMHNYPEEQQVSADIEAKREAGRKGGLARAKKQAAALAVLQAQAQAEAKQPANGLLQLDIDVDVDIEKERGASAPGKRSRAASRATPFPADFAVTSDMEAWAQTHLVPGLDLGIETEKFKNYHLSKGSTFKVWEAAWRTWITKAAEYAKQRQTVPGQREGQWW